MATRRALLLIADIGGYTRFLKTHAINLAHAHDVVAQLLEAVIDGAVSPLALAKLEGDAAFFYAPIEGKKDFARLAEVVAGMWRSFLARREQLRIDRACTCEGCTQVERLTLKFVAHQGEVALQRVKRFTELGGVDVILVHRMLKNSVPVREYVLMTEPVAQALAPDVQERTVPIEEELEGLGRVAMRYLDLASGQPPPPSLEPSAMRRWASWTRMTWRSLPYMLKLKQPCEGFRNFDPTPLPPGSPPAG